MMYYRKFFQTLAFFCILTGSLSAQTVDFRILYQWFSGPNNVDTLRLYVESASSTPLTINAVNFSFVYRSSCDSLISFTQIFTGLWGTFLEGNDTITLPTPKNYGGINYDTRIQYGNFGFAGITAPAIQDSALCFAEAIFKRDCPDYPYVEDESENGLNQWQGPLGPLTYEIIPIVVLPNFEFVSWGSINNTGLVTIDWIISDPSIINRMYLFKNGAPGAVWSGKADDREHYSFSEQLFESQATYQLWLETVDGNHFSSRKINLGWQIDQPQVEVFPNPASEDVSVLWQEGAPSAGLLKIFDAHGRLLQSLPVEEGEARVAWEFEKLPAGVYIMRWAGKAPFSRSFTITH
ncbi:MAG: T9SS type A sorting domain-containing protein [Bacteroidia bacterium]